MNYPDLRTATSSSSSTMLHNPAIGRPTPTFIPNVNHATGVTQLPNQGSAGQASGVRYNTTMGSNGLPLAGSLSGQLSSTSSHVPSSLPPGGATAANVPTSTLSTLNSLAAMSSGLAAMGTAAPSLHGTSTAMPPIGGTTTLAATGITSTTAAMPTVGTLGPRPESLLVQTGHNAQLTGGNVGIVAPALKVTPQGNVSCGPQRYIGKAKAFDSLTSQGYIAAEIISERFVSGSDICVTGNDWLQCGLAPGKIVSFVLTVNSEKKPHAEEIAIVDPLLFVPAAKDNVGPTEEDPNITKQMAKDLGNLSELVELDMFEAKPLVPIEDIDKLQKRERESRSRDNRATKSGHVGGETSRTRDRDERSRRSRNR
ncbi:unnamed protein product, partial [Amoebophrya sp. A25]|eukprot:GSA25T00011983001.1